MDQKHIPEDTQRNNALFKEPCFGLGYKVEQAQVTHHEVEQTQLCHCANCDIEFFWPPTVVQGKAYCCTGCAAGGPCNCDYSLYRSVTLLGIIYDE